MISDVDNQDGCVIVTTSTEQRTKPNMKTFNCTDGFVSKTIEAESAEAAAREYALVSCVVTVTDLEIGKSVEVKVEI